MLALLICDLSLFQKSFIFFLAMLGSLYFPVAKSAVHSLPVGYLNFCTESAYISVL